MNDARSLWPEPRWMEPHETPFGIRVLDCRSAALVMRAHRAGSEFLRGWMDLWATSGEEYRDRGAEDPVVVPCDLTFVCSPDLPEGLLHPLVTNEDLWLICRFGNWLVFVKAPDGRVELRAWHTIEPSGGGRMKLSRIEAARGFVGDSPDLAVGAVDFLIKSHLCSRRAPHPLPPALGQDLEALVRYSVETYGRHGLFGTFEETVGLPWTTWDLTELLEPPRGR